MVRGNQLVPFADMSFAKAVKDGLIKEIVIGPKVNMSIDEICNYLWVRGFDQAEIIIRKSEISYS